MQVTLKLLGGKDFTTELERNTKISDIKIIVSKEFNIPVESCRLIYKGKIYKDAQTLEDVDSEESCVFHVVKCGSSAAPPTTDSQKVSSSNTGDNSNLPPNFPTGNIPSTSDFGAGLGGGLNPEMMFRVLENPNLMEAMNSVLQNQDLLQQMIGRNPALQQMVNSNPMLREALTDPAVLRSMVNPETLRNVANIYQNFSGSNNNNSNESTTGNQNQMGMPANVAEMMGNISNMFNNPASNSNSTSNHDNSQRYASQITQLKEMGFTNETAVIQALSITSGNIDQAISYLLENGGAH